MSERLDALASRVRGWTQGRVRVILAERTAAMDAVRSELGAVRLGVDATERAAVAVAGRHDRTPFHLDMTVHVALSRHPAVAVALSRRGLPACADCAVGADETLGEAAFAEGFDASALVEELNRLPPVS